VGEGEEMRYLFATTTTLALLMVVTAATPVMAQWSPLSMRGFAEGYSHLPMSSHDKVYTDSYNDGVREHTFDIYDIGRGGGCVILGTWPAHSSDSYRDFYQGWIAGDNAYSAGEGHNVYNGNCPLGHSAEFCAGWKFGFNIPANGDAT
jgi:hypothetical protein